MTSYIAPIIASIAAIAATAAISIGLELPVRLLTQDIFLVTQTPPYASLLSNLSVFGWAFALSVLVLGAVALKDRATTQFLWWSAALTGFLFIDDFYMFHDHWIRLWFGKVDIQFYGVLGVLTLIYLLKFRTFILSTRYSLLGLAFAGFALSVGMDAGEAYFRDILGIWEYLLEDGAKWVGICFWVSYFYSVCIDGIRAAESA